MGECTCSLEWQLVLTPNCCLGFVFARLTVTRHHRTLAPTRCRSRYIHPSVYSLYGKSWRLSSAVTVYTPASRFVSTATPPPTKESSAQDVPLPSLGHGARPKVTLRPAPIKPNDLSPEVPPAPQPAASAGPLVEQASTAPKGSQGVHPSAVETVRWDYQDAAEHGILQPPPENASWFGRIYHQAKELFVSCSLSLSLLPLPQF